MQIIELDASNWNTISDYCNALKAAIKAPEGHGCGIDAFIDSMVWGGMNQLNPPYTIRIRNLEQAPDDVVKQVTLLKSYLEQARAQHREQHEHDVEVGLEISQ